MKFQGNPKGFFVCGFFHKIRLYYNDRSLIYSFSLMTIGKPYGDIHKDNNPVECSPVKLQTGFYLSTHPGILKAKRGRPCPASY